MNSISLDDEEECGLDVGETPGIEGEVWNQGFDFIFCIVGRFISEGRVDFMATQHTMSTLWKSGKGIFMKKLDSNLYLF